MKNSNKLGVTRKEVMQTINKMLCKYAIVKYGCFCVLLYMDTFSFVGLFMIIAVNVFNTDFFHIVLISRMVTQKNRFVTAKQMSETD